MMNNNHHFSFTARTFLQVLMLGGSALLINLHAEEKAAVTQDSDAQVVRPADEFFWVPTLEQAIEIATANRVPIFVMGYSLVGDRSTYTKFGDDCASAVF